MDWRMMLVIAGGIVIAVIGLSAVRKVA